MKRRKFTFIELLVVIGVIVILIAIATPVFVKVREKAKRAKAKGQISQLLTAVAGYQSTYQIIPLTGNYTAGGVDVILGTVDVRTPDPVPDPDPYYQDDYTTLIKCLSSNTGNPRKIRFLTLPTTSGTDVEYNDPWGNKFRVACDFDFDTYVNKDVVRGINQAVSGDLVIWSMGPDGADSDTHTDASNNDNVNSWNDN